MAENSNEEILHTLADINEAIGTNFEKVWVEFTNINDSFEKVWRKFAETDKRFDRVDQQLTHILERLNRIEALILEDHARRIEALERQIGATR